ncbi:MAG: hypothetical protein M1839_002836 [Geoglossum umbratile]|nr:MAG: hypothetical protein M1839_002836 [Geoglossum umbratile]
MGCSSSKEGVAVDPAPRPSLTSQPPSATLQKPSPIPAQAAPPSMVGLNPPATFPSATTPTPPPPVRNDVSPGAWPKTVEQGQTTIQIWHHPMSSPTQGNFYCWTYVSHGLNRVNQPEVVFTIRQRPNESENDYPQAPFEWVKLVYGYAGSGLHLQLFEPYDFIFEDSVQIVIHRVVALDSARKWESMKNFGMLTHGIPIEIASLPAGALPKDRHHVVALTPNEAAVAREFGRTRVIGQVGLAARWFPYPPWIDRDRSDCCTMADQQGSVRVRGLPMMHISKFSALKIHDTIVFKIPNDKERENAFRAVVRDSQLSQALGFESSLHEDADSGLVWKSGQTRPEAYGIDCQSMNRINLAFFIFCPQQDKDHCIMVEDGYSLMLKDNTWKNIRSAIEGRREIVIPLADNMRFRLEWTKTTYHNPIDGQAYSDRWKSYEPSNPGPQPDSHVRTEHIVLLREPAPNELSADALAAYIKQIHGALEALIPVQNPGGLNAPGKQVTIEIELPRSDSWLKVMARPSAEGLPVQDIGRAVAGVPSPQVRSPVKFQIVENLWGYKGPHPQFS